MTRLLAAATILLLLLPACALAQSNPSPPGVVTNAASSITTNAATVTGRVDPNGAATSYQIQYGTTASYGLTSASLNAGSGANAVAFSVRLAKLTQNTTYHFRVVATNAAGTSRSGDRSFRTKSTQKPAVTLAAAGPIAPRAATVTATVNPRGAATRYRFEYGQGTKTNLHTAYVAAGDGNAKLAVAAVLPNLAPDTKYSFRIMATSAAGTVRSGRRTFRTPVECTRRYPSKLSIARASTPGSLIDVLAPITSRASGRATIDYHAARQHTRFTVGINGAAGWIRFRRSVTAAQARLGTGILTIAYPGDGDTRPQTVRLRAARNKARLDLARPQIVNGRVVAAGSISDDARGVVRLQLSYQVNCVTRLLQFTGAISGGRWTIDAPLSAQALAEIAVRSGAVHSYTLFTGYLPERMRGEMRAFQVLGDP